MPIFYRKLLDITYLNICALYTPPGPKAPGVRQPPNIRFETRLEIAGEIIVSTPNLDTFSNALPAFRVLHLVFINDFYNSNPSINNNPEISGRNYNFYAYFRPLFPPIPYIFDLQIILINNFYNSILDICKHNFSFNLINYTLSIL